MSNYGFVFMNHVSGYVFSLYLHACAGDYGLPFHGNDYARGLCIH